MVNEIEEGLAAALTEILGDGCAVYPGEALQGLAPPCILAAEISAEQTPFLGRRRQHSRAYMLHYFPQGDETGMEECKAAAEKILGELHLIRAGEILLRCTDLHYTIDWDQRVAHIGLNVNTIAWEERLPGGEMEELDTEIRKKEPKT